MFFVERNSSFKLDFLGINLEIKIQKKRKEREGSPEGCAIRQSPEESNSRSSCSGNK
jgi:hypothetical protein